MLLFGIESLMCGIILYTYFISQTLSKLWLYFELSTFDGVSKIKSIGCVNSFARKGAHACPPSPHRLLNNFPDSSVWQMHTPDYTPRTTLDHSGLLRTILDSSELTLDLF